MARAAVCEVHVMSVQTEDLIWKGFSLILCHHTQNSSRLADSGWLNDFISNSWSFTRLGFVCWF